MSCLCEYLMRAFVTTRKPAKLMETFLKCVFAICNIQTLDFLKLLTGRSYQTIAVKANLRSKGQKIGGQWAPGKEISTKITAVDTPLDNFHPQIISRQLTWKAYIEGAAVNVGRTTSKKLLTSFHPKFLHDEYPVETFNLFRTIASFFSKFVENPLIINISSASTNVL